MHFKQYQWKVEDPPSIPLTFSFKLLLPSFTIVYNLENIILDASQICGQTLFFNKDSIICKYCFTAWFSLNKIVLISSISIHIESLLITVEFHNMQSMLYIIQADFGCLPSFLPSFVYSFIFAIINSAVRTIPVPILQMCLSSHLPTAVYEQNSQVDSLKSVVWVSWSQVVLLSLQETSSVGSIQWEGSQFIRLIAPRFMVREQPRQAEHWPKLSCIQLFVFSFPQSQSWILGHGHSVISPCATLNSSSVLFLYQVQHPSQDPSLLQTNPSFSLKGTRRGMATVLASPMHCLRKV